MRKLADQQGFHHVSNVPISVSHQGPSIHKENMYSLHEQKSQGNKLNNPAKSHFNPQVVEHLVLREALRRCYLCSVFVAIFELSNVRVPASSSFFSPLRNSTQKCHNSSRSLFVLLYGQECKTTKVKLRQDAETDQRINCGT